MVSPKTIVSNDGDKSPSPEPFREPEGMVTIDLNNSGSSKGKDDLKKDGKHEKRKCRMITKTLLFLSIFLVSIFAATVLLNEETYLFRSRSMTIITVTEATSVRINEQLHNSLPHTFIEDNIYQLYECLHTKSFEDCCSKFASSDMPEFEEFCSVTDMVDLIEKELRSKNPRKKRTISDFFDGAMLDKIHHMVPFIPEKVATPAVPEGGSDYQDYQQDAPYNYNDQYGYMHHDNENSNFRDYNSGEEYFNHPNNEHQYEQVDDAPFSNDYEDGTQTLYNGHHEIISDQNIYHENSPKFHHGEKWNTNSENIRTSMDREKDKIQIWPGGKYELDRDGSPLGSQMLPIEKAGRIFNSGNDDVQAFRESTHLANENQLDKPDSILQNEALLNEALSADSTKVGGTLQNYGEITTKYKTNTLFSGDSEIKRDNLKNEENSLKNDKLEDDVKMNNENVGESNLNYQINGLSSENLEQKTDNLINEDYNVPTPSEPQARYSKLEDEISIENNSGGFNTPKDQSNILVSKNLEEKTDILEYGDHKLSIPSESQARSSQLEHEASINKEHVGENAQNYEIEAQLSGKLEEISGSFEHDDHNLPIPSESQARRTQIEDEMSIDNQNDEETNSNYKTNALFPGNLEQKTEDFIHEDHNLPKTSELLARNSQPEDGISTDNESNAPSLEEKTDILKHGDYKLSILSESQARSQLEFETSTNKEHVGENALNYETEALLSGELEKKSGNFEHDDHKSPISSEPQAKSAKPEDETPTNNEHVGENTRNYETDSLSKNKVNNLDIKDYKLQIPNKSLARNSKLEDEMPKNYESHGENTINYQTNALFSGKIVEKTDNLEHNDHISSVTSELLGKSSNPENDVTIDNKSSVKVALDYEVTSIPTETPVSPELIDNVDEARANDGIRVKSKSDFTSDLQTNQQAIYNPCLYPFPYMPPMRMPTANTNDQQQLLKVIPFSMPRATQYILNPPMYPYMPSPYMQQYFPNYVQPVHQQQISPSESVQVAGPGGQYYMCNPIQPPVSSNNIASMPGIEVRRAAAANLQDLVALSIGNSSERAQPRQSLIICPEDQFGCSDGSRCLPKKHMCDNQVHCDDGSDEIFCSCKDRVGQLRQCDGYFDCPNGEDELGCFGCTEHEFSCDDWSRVRKSTCIPMEQRCDNIRQCEMTGKDEEDCSALSDNIGEQPQFKISNSVGFLHRNFRGKWYPTCFGTDVWALDVCRADGGPSTVRPKSHLMQNYHHYRGIFINILPNNQVSLVRNCIKDRAAFVECPPLFCGLRMTTQNPYRPQEVDTSAEEIINELERVAAKHDDDDEATIEEPKPDSEIVGDRRVVGGNPSQPAAWPWLVSIYKNGIFHCGGVLINEQWIVTAAHCVDRYWLYYYEIQAGMLRRFSFAPMEQNRWASAVIYHENYDRITLKNDISLMRLSSPVRFNRYVRPICLPSESTAGRDFLKGPAPGTICTTVGWGSTVEHGADPDHMREVEVPVLDHCKHQEDLEDDEICAGLSEGGKDACQGDSGGPFMCRNPNNPSQWYLAGIVSHGEGCARPNEPGVYTRVSKFVGWIAENINNEKFMPRVPLQRCPGYLCKGTGRCLPKKHHCDKLVDCLLGDDETNCRNSFHDIFKQADHSLHIDEMTRQSENSLRENIQNEERTKILLARNHTTDTSSDYFRCKSMFQFIPIEQRCNKMFDCEDGTDEIGCLCSDYARNYDPSSICDGITDCQDYSDEADCSHCDAETEYYCRRSKTCIPLVQRCDNKEDCPNGEDEWDCAALTDGRTLNMDSDLRPQLTSSGIITVNRIGVWRPFCANKSTEFASIAANICNLLGYEEYMRFDMYPVMDKALNINRQGEAEDAVQENLQKKCDGLYVRCSNVSVDPVKRGRYLDNVTEDMELYTFPWNAAIYSEGIYKCMGAVVSSLWILTSVNCFKGITQVETNEVYVLLGAGKMHLPIKGPHEQVIRVVESVQIPNTDIVLLGLEKEMNFTRYVKPSPINIRRDRHRREQCVTVGLESKVAKFTYLFPIQHCTVGFRCFESKILQDCQNMTAWSGTIVCDSGNGWYPAAVFSEKTGRCGLSSSRKYTSVRYHKHEINDIIGRAPSRADALPCEGFRCALGECINKNATCDGVPHCRDAEDEGPDLCYKREMACHLSGECNCPHSHIKCKDGRCIHKSSFCDTINDCGEFEDEPAVCSCRTYLQLTNPDKICDGVLNCVDRTDEDPKLCPCRLDSFFCPKSQLCVPHDLICDGYKDCPDGEDEQTCLSLNVGTDKQLNAGEVMVRTAGIWHPGCFKANFTSTELEDLCSELDFPGGSAAQLRTPTNILSTNTLHPKFDHFNSVWIHKQANNSFRLSMRSGNEPYMTLVEDEECHRLFIACL